MAEDTRLPADHDHAGRRRLSSAPPYAPVCPPGPRRPARPAATRSPTAPGEAWWTRPPPTEEAVPPGHPQDQGYHRQEIRVGQPGRPPPTAPSEADPRLTSVATSPGERRTGRHGVKRTLMDDGRRRAWTILAVLGSAPLLAALAVVALMPDPPPAPQPSATLLARPVETTASRSSREPTTVTPSATPTRPSGVPADLAQVAADVAAEDLRRAGISVQGSIGVAWGWTDGRGRSLVVGAEQVMSQGDDGSPTGVGLRVYYITGLDGHPIVRRKLRDPSLRCSDGGTVVAAFTAPAFGVRDLDGDGPPEVMIGWTARCGDPDAASRVRLAVMSGNSLYVLRGSGVVTERAVTTPSRDPGPSDQGGPSGSSSGGTSAPTPVPSASQWPAALLDAALATFHSVYYY
jgi:hypothetical protein